MPQIGSEHERGFIDTGSELPGLGDQWDQHVYVSIVAVEEMARMIGGGSVADMVDRDTQIHLLEGRVAEVEAERDALQVAIDGIDHIESAGFTARKKTGRPPGRPPKTQEQVPA